ncbi:Lamb2 [Symbiodinium sp. CCMP2456]|nr:Lamb2 [Symbiodinium sp. CCMP2456]
MAEDLGEAAKSGNVPKVKALLKKCQDFESAKVQNACVGAAIAQQAECVQAFLEAGAPLTCSDKEGRRLLPACCRSNLAESIALMVSLRADVSKPDGDGSLPMSLAIQNKSMSCVKELLRGGAQPPANADMPGLANLMLEVQFEQCEAEIRPLATAEVDPAELLEAERVVLEGMEDHKRLIKLHEDTRASKSLAEVERQIADAQAKLEATKASSVEYVESMNQKKIAIRNAEAELHKLHKEIHSVQDTYTKLKEEDAKLKQELITSHEILKEAQAERDALEAARLEREQLTGKVQEELQELEKLIEEQTQQNAGYQHELLAAREDLESKMRDKEEAKLLTEKAHQLVDTL